jgi:hypothetical protein
VLRIELRVSHVLTTCSLSLSYIRSPKSFYFFRIFIILCLIRVYYIQSVFTGPMFVHFTVLAEVYLEATSVLHGLWRSLLDPRLCRALEMLSLLMSTFPVEVEHNTVTLPSRANSHTVNKHPFCRHRAIGFALLRFLWLTAT